MDATTTEPKYDWQPVKTPQGNYIVATSGGIRCNPWVIAKLCHAKVRTDLMRSVVCHDQVDVASADGKLAILRVTAHNKAFERWEASDRSRNYPEAVASWNAYVGKTKVIECDGRLSAIEIGCRMDGWVELPGILPMVGGA